MAPEASQKKRKRQQEKDNGPSKKRALDSNEIAHETTNSSGDKVKLTRVASHESWVPVVASTPGISIPASIKFDAYHNDKRNELLLHSSDHPRLDYTAREHQEGGVQDHLKHYIAIYDPEKKEAQVVEARHMSLRTSLRTEEQELRKEQKRAGETNSQRFNKAQLGLEYGTKKQKQKIEAKAQNMIRTIKDPAAVASSKEAMQQAVKANSAAAAVLESMADGAANAPTQEATEKAVLDAKPGPKPVAAAMGPDAAVEPYEAYSIDDVIGNDLMEKLKVKAWFEAIEDGEEGVKTSSLFVAHRLKSIVLDRDDDAVVKVRILKWMLIAMNFYKACKRIKNKRKLPSRDELKAAIGEDNYLIDAARKKFAPAGGEMSKWDVDNLRAHLALYSLMVDDYKTDIYDLRQDLELDVPEMRNYFRAVGAKVSNFSAQQISAMGLSKSEAAQHKVAELVIPLALPKQRIHTARGSKR